MANEIDPSVTHPDFDKLEDAFEMCEDAFCGDVCEYVETLDGQSANEKAAYVKRAAYFGVVQPTVTALIGAMTRKPYTLTGGDFPETDFSHPDAFIQTNLKNLLLGARTIMMVTVEDGASKIVTYDADDVINWAEDFIVIKETSLVRDKDNPFLQVPFECYRELYLDENGLYRSRQWVMQDKKWVAGQLPDMLVQGKPIDFLPVFVANPYDNSWEVHTPPLFTQSAQNIQHFKQACDLAHYAHFMALPTPVIVGDLYEYQSSDGTPLKAKVHLGSSKEVLHLSAGSEFKYGEVSGASFTMLQSELKNIEERMFISGSRLLTVKKGVESAEALQLRSGSESATLETLVTSYEAALQGALDLCSMIDRSNLVITLNRDFTTAVTDPALLKSLLELYVAKVITLEQFQQELISSEVVDGSKLANEFTQQLDQDAGEQDDDDQDDQSNVTPD